MKLVTIAAAAAALALAGTTGAQAQAFPSKPITIVVGFPAGGPTDTVARVLADHMKGTLGQSVIVENKAGAAGTLGLTHVSRADPDGHTLYVGNWTVNVGAVRTFEVPYNPLTGFEPVALLTTSKLWILARKDLPAEDAKGLIAWLKANPGKGNAASVGVGSAAHVCLVDFMQRSGTNFQVVTYRGGAPAVQDLAGGQADFSCLEAGQTLGLYRGGKVKIIGVASKTRFPAAKEVPTLGEGGLPGAEIDFWHGLWAPKNTPKAVVDRLTDAVQKAFADATVQKRFADVGHSLPAKNEMSPKALVDHHKAELDKWWPIMEKAGIKMFPVKK
ncbi:MAG: tripartite tricarboxylate transporter substrate binding protein BugD [Alphaproteobacteria bacterium]|nr:tripartite tricarboxylate transporter substrate binding protein BugD [Alphaproteobacteria bacterium]